MKQNFLFASMLTARYVEVTVHDNNYNVANSTVDGDRVGFADIAFVLTPTPEPASMTLLARHSCC